MSKRKGFTLLELLVVVAIIAIIAVIAIPNYMGAVDKAKDARDLAEKASVQQATTLYYMTEGLYPTSSQPTEGSPQTIDLSALIPNYLSKQPNYASWVVDYQGKVSHGLGGSTPTLTSGDPATMLTEAQWATFDWSKVQPPAGQTSGSIGVDSWGNPVNMDLWSARKVISSDSSAIQGYTPVGTIALSAAEGNPYAGYTGTYIGGTIEGFVPARVKLASEPSFASVTNVDNTFYNSAGLVTAPIMPNTVQSMALTYTNCIKLTTVPALPPNVQNLDGTFGYCSSLRIPPAIPASVTYAGSTFENCVNLEVAVAFPIGIDTVDSNTYFGCTKLGY